DPAAAREYLASAGRMLGPAPVTGSPLFARRSLERRFDGVELPLTRLKAASKRLDGTVNDVFLAGLIGGFRRFHEEMGFPPAPMPIGFPISIRAAADAPGGNRFTGAQYAAPVAER